MRQADGVLLGAAAVLLCCSAGHGAEPPSYGQVETFEPGKKYTCVPTPDRKGWDCSEAGKPTQPHAPVAAPPAAAPVPVSVPTAPSAPAAVPAQPADSHSSALPGYLTNSGAGGRARATPPAQAAAAVPPPQAAPTPSPPTPSAAASSPPAPLPPAAAPASTVAAEPEHAAAVEEPPPPMKKPVPTPVAPAVAARTPTGSARNVSRSGSDFLNLPGDRFVVELAHGASESDLAATRASLHPSDGDLYTVHLRQNGADIWLLVWGSFDSIDAARSARSEMAAQGTIMPGWPRKIAPLQAEVRRVLDQ